MGKDLLREISEALDRGPLAAMRGGGAPAERGTPGTAEACTGDGRLFPADMDEGARIRLFAQRAESSGARVHEVADRAALKAAIEEIVGDGSLVAIATEERPGKEPDLDVEDLVPDSCSIAEIGDSAGDDLYRIDAAITDVDLAVAETGSILLGASAARRRALSLVPLIHIALVRPDRIVADLTDWADRLPAAGDREAPGGLTLISGPSKTADIEMELVTGVHGPGELHLVVLEGF